MSHEVKKHLSQAQFLYQQACLAGLDRGCIEISLASFGVTMHIIDILDRNRSNKKALMAALQRDGMDIDWNITIHDPIHHTDLSSVLNGDLNPFFSTSGPTAGFLCIEDYQNESDEVSHAIAILPRGPMPRDWRRKLKKKNAYVVVDTRGFGTTALTVNELTANVNRTIEKGGQYIISRVKRLPYH